MSAALLDTLALLVDDHAFDGDAWRCGCGYSCGGTSLEVLRDHRRHVATAVLDALGLEQVGWKDTSGLAWIRTFGLHADDQHQKDCCPSDGCVPVFTARTSGRAD